MMRWLKMKIMASISHGSIPSIFGGETAGYNATNI